MTLTSLLPRAPNPSRQWMWWGGAAALVAIGGYALYRKLTCAGTFPDLPNWTFVSVAHHPNALTPAQLDQMKAGDRVTAVYGHLTSVPGRNWDVIDPSMPLTLMPARLMKDADGAASFELTCRPRPVTQEPETSLTLSSLTSEQRRRFSTLSGWLLPGDYRGPVRWIDLGEPNLAQDTLAYFAATQGSAATAESVAQAAYPLLFPSCPEHLDPDDPSHAQCIRSWSSLRDAARQYA